VRSREQRRVDREAMSWPEPARLLLRELNDGWKIRDARNGAADEARFQFRKPLDV
jgi:Flp pilus assembly protein TadB